MPAEDFKPAQDQNQNQTQNQTPGQAPDRTPAPDADTPSPVTSAYEGYDGAPSDIETGVTGQPDRQDDRPTASESDSQSGGQSEDDVDDGLDNGDPGDASLSDIELDEEDEDLDDEDDTVRQDGALG